MNGDTTGVWLFMAGLSCIIASLFLCTWMGKYPASSPEINYLPPTKESQITNLNDNRLNYTQFLARPKITIPYLGGGKIRARNRMRL